MAVIHVPSFQYWKIKAQSLCLCLSLYLCFYLCFSSWAVDVAHVTESDADDDDDVVVDNDSDDDVVVDSDDDVVVDSDDDVVVDNDDDVLVDTCDRRLCRPNLHGEGGVRARLLCGGGRRGKAASAGHD